MVACRFLTWKRSRTAALPSSSVSPTLTPPLIPPPASHIVNPYELWSRPVPWAYSAVGCRPNSPPQTTSVESSSPRRLRSWSSPALGIMNLLHEAGHYGDHHVEVATPFAASLVAPFLIALRGRA